MEKCAIGSKRGEIGLGRAAADAVIGCGPWRWEPGSNKLIRLYSTACWMKQREVFYLVLPKRKSGAVDAEGIVIDKRELVDAQARLGLTGSDMV